MSDVKPVGFVQKAKLERLVSGYSVVAALYKDNFADEVPIYSQATIDALQAEIEALRSRCDELDRRIAAEQKEYAELEESRDYWQGRYESIT
jgi:chromosome segregation ATPase